MSLKPVRLECEPFWRDSLWHVATPLERLKEAVLCMATRNCEDGYCWCPEDWPMEWRHSERCSKVRDAMRSA